MEQNQEPQSSRPMTSGEKLVGLTFNPSGDPKVHRAKQLCAELADLVNEDHNENTPLVVSPEITIRQTLFEHTIGEILNAQMNVVKFLTFKY